MAKKKFERSCSVCGKKYEYCPNCSDFDHLPRWMDAYCSETCKDLYNITAGFINKWLEPEVEAARLTKVDLSYMDKLPAWMKTAIKEIQKVDTQNASAINEALEDKKEVENKVEEKEEVEKKEEVKPQQNKQQNAKVERKPDNKAYAKVEHKKIIPNGQHK